MRETMIWLGVFWLGWLVAGAAGFQYWMDAACESTECSYLIVILEAPELVLWVLGWSGIGLGVSAAIWRSWAVRRHQGD